MDSLKKILDSAGCNYELIGHDTPILTAKEGAGHFGIEIGQTAPTLILETDNGFRALIISGDRSRIDFGQLARALGYRQVKLASKKDVKRVTGCDAGSVSMINIPVPCILDRRLFRYPFVYGGSGYSTRTLKIAPQALARFNKVIAVVDEELGGVKKRRAKGPASV